MISMLYYIIIIVTIIPVPGGGYNMKRKSRIALLLAAVMLLGLTACSAKPEARAYEAPLHAFEALLNNADAAWPDAVQAAVGDFCGDELTRIAQLMIRTGETTDERMTENLLGGYREAYGYDCTFSFSVVKAEPMDDAMLAHYRDQLQSDSAFFDQSLQEVLRDGAIDWESGQPLEETVEMEGLYTTLRDRFRSAEVSEGYVLTLLLTISGGDLKEPEQAEDTMNVVCMDGVWVIGDVFDVTYTQ